jgi:hypothetical protein
MIKKEYNRLKSIKMGSTYELMIDYLSISKELIKSGLSTYSECL